MKVFIQEIEELVVTDPAGLCNPSTPQLPGLPGTGIPIGQPANPGPPMMPWPTPQVPSPFNPIPRPYPGTGDILPSPRPTIWTKAHGDPNDPFSLRTKWGVGGSAIQQAGDALEQEKWERNWQANQPEIYQLSERSKRIMRGEDPDGN